jgi:hypothetical protein
MGLFGGSNAKCQKCGKKLKEVSWKCRKCGTDNVRMVCYCYGSPKCVHCDKPK